MAWPSRASAGSEARSRKARTRDLDMSEGRDGIHARRLPGRLQAGEDRDDDDDAADRERIANGERGREHQLEVAPEGEMHRPDVERVDEREAQGHADRGTHEAEQRHLSE